LLKVPKDKAEYFHRLYSLIDPSDEEDTNDVGQVLRQIQRPNCPSSSSFHPVANRRGTQVQKKVPAIQRATSAPVSSDGKETPTLPRKTSLLRYDLSTPESSTSMPIIEAFTAEQMPNLRPDPERSTSTPNIGSVVMTNSMGIESMLKKKKRKRSSLTLVPENERIFAGHTFFWIPPDDVAPLRRTRITKSISYGVTWTKEWVPSITHVVVDNDLEYKDVIAFLKSTLKVDTLSPEITLVNADYPLDCIQFRALLDPQQRRYVKNASILRISHCCLLFRHIWRVYNS
jgi:DNA polymerase IV